MKFSTVTIQLCCLLQEEALRAFVEPETLDGSNQYFCEKCACKCDAHKVYFLLFYHLQLSVTFFVVNVTWYCMFLL